VASLAILRGIPGSRFNRLPVIKSPRVSNKVFNTRPERKLLLEQMIRNQRSEVGDRILPARGETIDLACREKIPIGAGAGSG
jgi:hypothetical protein